MRAIGIGLFAAAAACGLPEGEYFGKVGEPDPTHLTYCNTGEPEYLDPALASSTTDLKPIYALFDSLTEYGQDGLPTPSLATSWDISPDQRRFVFHLRSDARWSNGRPLTAHDFVYGITRVLHPKTGSKNAETHWRLKNGKLYSAGRVKRVLRDGGGFRAGDVVEIIGLDGAIADDPDALALPDSNARAGGAPLRLRDLGAGPADAYATVPAGAEVTLVELGGPADAWAYVFRDDGDGVYGWVPAAELDRQPNAGVRYTVRRVGREHWLGVMLPPDPPGTIRRTGVVAGAALVMLPDLLGLRAPDDHTLELETFGPVPYLLDETAQRAFRPTPREVVSRWPKQWVYPEHIVTSGPFHLREWIQRDRIELVRSATFWGRAGVRLARLTFLSMNDQSASANTYLEGGCDIDGANNIPSSYLPVMTRRGYKDFHVDPFLGVYFYIINTQKLRNVHFRRALNFAVDRSPLPSLTRGFEIPTAQYMPGVPIADLSPAELALCGVKHDDPGVAAMVVSGKLCYVPPPGLDFDPARARAELALAKRELGAAYSNHLTLKFNSGVESHKLIAEWMQQQWQRVLGLDVDLESQEWKTFLKDTSNGEFEVARMGNIGNFPDPEAEFLAQMKCDNPDNRPKFCNPEFEALFARAEATADRKARLAIIREAERVLIENAAIIPLYVYTQKNLVKPYVRGYGLNLVDKQPFGQVWIDPAWRTDGAGGAAP